MTEATLRKLTRRSKLTGKQRASLMREANRRLMSASNIMACVMDSCGDDANKINEDDDATAAEETRACRLDDVHGELEDLVEKLDNLDVPEPKDVL